MSRTVRSALLAFVLLVLCAAPGTTAAADSAFAAIGNEVADPTTQLSSGSPVARSGGRSSTVDRGVACGRSDVRVYPVIVGVLPASIGVRPLARWESLEVEREAVAGTAGSCAAGRAPPQATPTSR